METCNHKYTIDSKTYYNSCFFKRIYNYSRSININDVTIYMATWSQEKIFDFISAKYDEGYLLMIDQMRSNLLDIYLLEPNPEKHLKCYYAIIDINLKQDLNLSKHISNFLLLK